MAAIIGIIIILAIAGAVSLTCHVAVPGGRHAADSQASADWHPPTPMPALAPLPDWEPRYIPDVLTPSDLVRDYYEIAERIMTGIIEDTVSKSRQAWAAAHA